MKTLKCFLEENLRHMWPVLLNKRFFFFFSFFLLSLFAPLNGIQQLEDISDTQLSGSFYLLFVPYGHNLCVTQPCRHGVFG
jgi:hypothetical protein